MNWIILLVTSILAAVVFFVITAKTDLFENEAVCCGSAIAGAIMVLVALWAAIALIGIGLFVPEKIAIYEAQKDYIETHTAENPVENAVLTSKKIELNEWLYKAQCSNERYGMWSLYPDSVQSMTPIE